LIQAQGEMLDNIEANLNDANDRLRLSLNRSLNRPFGIFKAYFRPFLSILESV
jgi:hypothetical protein